MLGGNVRVSNGRVEELLTCIAACSTLLLADITAAPSPSGSAPGLSDGTRRRKL